MFHSLFNSQSSSVPLPSFSARFVFL
jgi:hypothetical protein